LFSSFVFSIIPFILRLLKGFFAALWNNQLSELRIGLMAAPSEYTMISNKIMSGPGYECGEFA